MPSDRPHTLKGVAGGNWLALTNQLANMKTLAKKNQDCAASGVVTGLNQNDSKTSWCQGGKDVCTY